MPVPTRDALHRAVLDHPADDTPRLVLADWLDEFGGPAGRARAELVRAQCEWSALDRGEHLRAIEEQRSTDCPGKGCPVCLRWRHLKDRTAALLKQWAARWVPLRAGYPFFRAEGATVWLDPLHGYAEFRRGFIGRVGVELPWRADELRPAAEAFGRRLRCLLRANPVESFRVGVEGCRPELEFRIDHDPGRFYPWQVTAESDPQDDEGLTAVHVWMSRRELLRELTAFVPQVVSDLEFDRYHDDAFEDDAYQEQRFDDVGDDFAY